MDFLLLGIQKNLYQNITFAANIDIHQMSLNYSHVEDPYLYGRATDYFQKINKKAYLEIVKTVKHNGYSIQYVRNLSDEEKLEAVKQNGHAIRYIENPSEEIKLEAVKRSGCAIRYIENPSEQMKLEAVKQYGDAIEYIKNPSEEVKSIAEKKSIYAIIFLPIFSVYTEKIIFWYSFRKKFLTITDIRQI